VARITIRGLSKRYPAQAEMAPALDALDLEVQDGELLVLVGPSGCGKSTALRLIAGLEEASSGAIDIDGRHIVGVAPQDRDVAMVFQGYALYPHMTVAENMSFPLRMRKVAAAARKARVAEIAALVGLADKLDRLPGELSGGERQRVAMGRAIVRSPKVFLFDEPLSNLDAKLRAELRVELAALVRRLGTTAIYVTHDQAEAMTMADRVAVLRAGVLQQVDVPRAIYERPANAFVASFVGTPQMNLLTLDCNEGRARAEGIDFAVPARLAAERVQVGFRPEHVRLDAEGEFAARLEAVVRAVEPLGPETLVYLCVGNEEIRARIPGFGGPEVGTAVTLTVAADHLHWFAEGGAREAT
jgi:multiple sugar transport system ATP-binding protein